MCLRPHALLAFLALLCTVNTALADQIVDSGAGYAALLSAFSGSSVQGQGPNPVVLVPGSPLQPYSTNISSASGGASGSVQIGVTESNGNVGLHGSATSNAPLETAYPNEPPASQAFAYFDLYYYDQFFIGGTGPQTFQYALTLDGSASLVGDPSTDGGFSLAYGGLSLYANSSYQDTAGTVLGNNGCGGYYYSFNENSCGVIASDSINAKSTTNGTTIIGDVTFQGGSDVELGLYLWTRTMAYNVISEDPGSADILASFNAADTGYLELTPVTPGASFTTTSGMTYAADPDSVQVATTPEPSELILMSTGLAMILTTSRRRLRALGLSGRS